MTKFAITAFCAAIVVCIILNLYESMRQKSLDEPELKNYWLIMGLSAVLGVAFAIYRHSN